MEMNVAFLQSAGASVVARFRAEGVPLNDGIVKLAADNEMNSEQVARLVEAVNSLAYLSGPHVGMDKTAEFPVASYDEVMTAMLTPTAIEKAASVKTSPLDLIRQPMEKVATVTEIPYQATEVTLYRQLQSCKENYDRAVYDGELVAEALVKQANVVQADEDAINKIAAFYDNDADKSADLCRLVFGHVKEARHCRRDPGALLQVKALHDVLGLAKEAMVKKASLKQDIEKIAELLAKKTGLQKEAFLGAAIRGGLQLAKGVPNIAGGAAKGGATVKKGLKLGGTAVVAGPEIGQISSNAAPKADVWKSLHQ